MGFRGFFDLETLPTTKYPMVHYEKERIVKRYYFLKCSYVHRMCFAGAHRLTTEREIAFKVGYKSHSGVSENTVKSNLILIQLETRETIIIQIIQTVYIYII